MHKRALSAARLALLVAGSVTPTLLPPTLVEAESRIQTGAANATLNATAHVNFKIVIPQVLYLHVDGGTAGAAGAQTVAVMSNGRNVTLNATLRTPDSNVPARGNLILSAAARKIIAQDARCMPPLAPVAAPPAGVHGPGNIGTRQVICTVSMP